ncbi:MAG: archease [Syntrophales bacterium]|nr:archease [Syntrophales bacterium]MDD5233469.1 archease [Syntrophales bacterium]MDD5533027.1 archease [Syntrophales bacterium]HPL64010.1 archease [Syntrophales bacterium]
MPDDRNLKPRYRFIDHTADLGIEVRGETERDLFANAALAVHDLIADTRTVRPRESRVISVSGIDSNDLLVNFLREVLYLFNGERMLAANCTILEMDGERVKAELRGEIFDRERHALKKEIKAVTHHQADLRRGKGGWKARIIFDV